MFLKRVATVGLGILLISTFACFVGAQDFSFGRTDSIDATVKVNVGGADGGNEYRDEQLLDVIRGAVNRGLGILGGIALIFLIYGGFLMVTAAGNEDQYSKGFKFLKAAAIGLTLIGLAWFIVSIIFWLTVESGTAAEGSSAQTDQ